MGRDTGAWGTDSGSADGRVERWGSTKVEPTELTAGWIGS